MSRILLASDLHDCHIDWYGVPTEERMRQFASALREEYEKEPYDLLLLLGDYSLDFWVWEPYGSVLARGVSTTERFLSVTLPSLPEVETVLLPGNHEQYGNEKWKKLTGRARPGSLVYRDNLFLFPDTFGGLTDPDVHSDGVYLPADTVFLRTEMEKYPDKRVFLCAHHFDAGKESEEFRELLSDPRVTALFAGHDHLSHIENFFGKPLLRTGNFSYSKDITRTRWGFRELRFGAKEITSRYIQPAQTLLIDGIRRSFPEETSDEWSCSLVGESVGKLMKEYASVLSRLERS